MSSGLKRPFLLPLKQFSIVILSSPSRSITLWSVVGGTIIPDLLIFLSRSAAGKRLFFIASARIGKYSGKCQLMRGSPFNEASFNGGGGVVASTTATEFSLLASGIHSHSFSSFFLAETMMRLSFNSKIKNYMINGDRRKGEAGS